MRQTPNNNGKLTCNSNQFIQDGKCVGSCASRFYPDSTTRQCISCPTNCVNCFSSSFCIICETGFQMVAGKCVKANSCPATKFEYYGQCIDTCPVGTYSIGSICYRSCPEGNYYLSQICYISCPTKLRTN